MGSIQMDSESSVQVGISLISLGLKYLLLHYLDILCSVV